jgi:hypothetical protein
MRVSHPFRMLNDFGKLTRGIASLRLAQPLATFFHPSGVILSLMPMWVYASLQTLTSLFPFVEETTKSDAARKTEILTCLVFIRCAFVDEACS